MKMTPKRCVQCGILKAPTDFRKYTYVKGSSKEVRYRVCRECEALNMRYKRAINKGDAETFEQIHEMYKALDALGYRTPLTTHRVEHNETGNIVDKILGHHGVKVSSVIKRDPDHGKPKDTPEEVLTVLHGNDGDTIEIKSGVAEPTEVPLPEELQEWLDMSSESWADQGLSPEFLQETIYESLKAKYRPQTGVDKELFIPIYDNTYKEALNKILRRFDDYEEQYSNEDEDYESGDNVYADEAGDISTDSASSDIDNTEDDVEGVIYE